MRGLRRVRGEGGLKTAPEGVIYCEKGDTIIIEKFKSLIIKIQRQKQGHVCGRGCSQYQNTVLF